MIPSYNVIAVYFIVAYAWLYHVASYINVFDKQFNDPFKPTVTMVTVLLCIHSDTTARNAHRISVVTTHRREALLKP